MTKFIVYCKVEKKLYLTQKLLLYYITITMLNVHHQAITMSHHHLLPAIL